MTRDERQDLARKRWILSKCKGTIVAPTGVGKSRVALLCMKSLLDKYPCLEFIIVVPTMNLKDQWESHLSGWGFDRNSTVFVLNTAIKEPRRCDVLIVDEIHTSMAELMIRLFDTVSYRYVLGLTATYERLDNRHVLLRDRCPVVDEITTREALENGWISDFREYMVLLDVDDIDVYRQYNKDFVQNFEFFNFDFALAMGMVGKDGFRNRKAYAERLCPRGSVEERKKALQLTTYRATMFMKTIQRRKAFVNNHPRKIEVCREIIAARGGSKILTFSNNVKMAESIDGNPVYTGKMTKKKGRITLEEFNEGDFSVLHSVKRLVVGADIPNLSVGIVMGHDSSRTRAIQTRGRIIRKEGDKQAEIFNLVINDTIESKWFTNSHVGSPYTVIGEDGLRDVLDGREPRPYVKKIRDFALRY